MSGAISAGAYTAGVFDFLIRALAEWHAGKPADEPEVNLVAFTGASAGGVTAALGAIQLGYGLPCNAGGTLDLTPLTRPAGLDPLTCVMPKLHDAWVVRPDMVASGGNGGLLATEDLEQGGELRSVLNWKVLDAIKAAATEPLRAPPYGPAVPFMAEPFHVYLTNSNLRGIPYVVGSGSDVYKMLAHGDRLHYRITGIGSAATASKFGENDSARRKLAVEDLKSSRGVNADWQDFGEAALTTAAFPGGLSARLLSAAPAEFQNRLWPEFMAGGAAIDPQFPDHFPAPEPTFGFANVDGGMINNDPFEYARFTLIEDWNDPSAHNARDPSDADRAVIMISPFPEGAVFDAKAEPKLGLVDVLSQLAPTLIQQARFKPSQIALAAAKDVASRWIIAPRRTQPPGQPGTSAAIACGLLGGFGGFLDRTFREHDYQLGMRNCQKFLGDGLVLDGLNATVFGTGGTAGPRPVLRLLGSAKQEIPLPKWPRMSLADLDRLQDTVKLRAKKVFDAVLPSLSDSWVVRKLAQGAWVWKRNDVFETVARLIVGDLIRRDQIEDGLAGPPPGNAKRLCKLCETERQILAALADPGFDLRTPSGIATTLSISVEKVQQTLRGATDLPCGAVHRVWHSGIVTESGEQTYALERFRPAKAETLPIIGAAVRWTLGFNIG
jgi:hypothetical protein